MICDIKLLIWNSSWPEPRHVTWTSDRCSIPASWNLNEWFPIFPVHNFIVPKNSNISNHNSQWNFNGLREKKNTVQKVHAKDTRRI